LHDEWVFAERLDNGVGRDNATLAYHVALYSGYVLGAADVFFNAGFRFPSGTLNEQIWHVVGNYLDNHPEEWNKWATEVIASALIEAWPQKVPTTELGSAP
jgi:hypothetical protein